jgi:hypothetical protein
VGVGVDATVDAQANTLTATGTAGGIGNALNLPVGINNNRAYTNSHCTLDLGDGFVVAVKTDVCRVNTCGEGNREFATAGNVNIKASIDNPAHYFGAQERLARVIDLGARTNFGKRGVEGLTHPASAGFGVVFVDDVQRSRKTVSQLRNSDTANSDFAGTVTNDRISPDAWHEGVGINRFVKPRGRQGVGHESQVYLS